MSTMVDTRSMAPEQAHSTWKPMSASRQEGILWAERLMSTVSSASKDGERFLKGLSV